MLCGWATATPAGSSNARRRRDACAPLPDELLVEVFSKLPKQKADLLGDPVSLETRGAVERVCRRWRRLALQRLPASLDIDFCELHEMGLDYVDAEDALEELLPHIEARSIDQCCLQGCTAAVAPALPAKLARAVFPQVRKLSLGGGSLLHFSSFLMLGSRLEALCLRHDRLSNEQAELLGTHLCALPGQLKELRLQLNELHPVLGTFITEDVDPVTVALHTSTPSPAIWLPQLEQCAVQFSADGQLAQLAAGLQRPEARGVRALQLFDARPAADRAAAPAGLPALADLPQLHSLKCTNCLPEAAWRCRHLTKLLCTAGSVQLSDGAGVLCTGLQQMHLRSCALPGNAFPTALCVLSQLSSLHLIHCDIVQLPPAFSKLSSLRELAIRCGRLDTTSMAAVAPLRHLTSLALSNCHLTSLPHGKYLLGLRSLELSGWTNNLTSPLPFAATAARGLRRLTINCPAPWLDGMECWADLEWKLHCFPRLELMCFEPDRWDDYGQPELAALADLCRATFPRCAVLADRAQFCTDIAHISQLPWFIRQATDIDAEDFFS